MADTSDFRKGLCLEIDGEIYSIVDFQHVKPGKGPAFVRTKLKNIATQRIREITYNSGVKVTTARVERREAQYLYRDNSGYHFMDHRINEMCTLPEHLVPNKLLLKEGQDQIEITVHAESGQVLDCRLPTLVSLRVDYAEPGIRGDTVNNPLKSATLETGKELKVPLFIKTGDTIQVDTRTHEFAKREKGASQ